MAAQQQQSSEEVETKPDVKPRSLATMYLGPPGLLQMIGSGDEEHIIMRVVPGTDPLQDFEDDDPSQFIVIDDDTDESSDVDDLSEVSMASAGGIGKQEFQALLSDIAAQHQRMAASLASWPRGSKICQWSRLKRRQYGWFQSPVMCED